MKILYTVLALLCLLALCAEVYRRGNVSAYREMHAHYSGKVVAFPANGDQIAPMVERGPDLIQFAPGTYTVKSGRGDNMFVKPYVESK